MSFDKKLIFNLFNSGGAGGGASGDYYLRQLDIAIPTRYAGGSTDFQNTTYFCSKCYNGAGIIELDDYYLIPFVSDNNFATPSILEHFDQTCTIYKSKTDGLPFYQGWTYYADEDGEFIPIVPSEFNLTGNLWRGQQWMATPHVFSDADVRFYYSANTTLSSNYRVFRGSLDFTGFPGTAPTLTRYAEVIAGTGAGGDNRFQFHHSIYDGANWYLVGPNVEATGTNGRFGEMIVYKSTDGTTGITFEEIKNDIYEGTDIDKEGFSLQGGLFQESGSWKAMATKTPVPDYPSNHNLTSNTIYTRLNADIIKVKTDDALEDADQVWEEDGDSFYTVSNYFACGVFPSSKPFSHGGYNWIVTNKFGWKIESGEQNIITVALLSDMPAQSGEQLITGTYDIVPDWLGGMVLADQSAIAYTLDGTDLNPIEVISQTAGTIVGTPIRKQLNSIGGITPTDYVQIPNSGINFNTEYMVIWVHATRNAASGTLRPLFEKEGVIKMWLNSSNRLFVEVVGSNGNTKRVRSSGSIASFETGIFLYHNRYAALLRLNAGGTDFDIELSVDYDLNISQTVELNEGAFTSLASNSNALKLGAATGHDGNVNVLQSVLWAVGDTGATWANYLNNEFA